MNRGLAGERTDLAWNRSGLAVLVVMVALARRALPLDRADHLLALALMGIGATAWVLGLLIARTISQSTHGGRLTVTPSTLRWVTIGSLALAGAGFVLGLFPPTT